MAQVSEIHLAHIPPEISVYISLFKDIKNAAYLRQQLLAGNTDFEYAFIDARMILTLAHILASVFRSINDLLHDRLKSRNVHSEIVFNLSPTNNIADSFRRFGVTDDTNDLLAIKIGVSGNAAGETRRDLTLESVRDHLTSNVQGESLSFDEEHLASMTDMAAINKVYKLGGPAGKKQKPNAEVNGGLEHDRQERREAEVTILGMMALKGS